MSGPLTDKQREELDLDVAQIHIEEGLGPVTVIEED